MNINHFIPGILCVIVALVIMFRLMHYAPFYTPSYFFWIGLILLTTGLISLIKPLSFLFILNRTIAYSVIGTGLLIAVIALIWPYTLSKTGSNNALDRLQPVYSSNEYHEVIINASIDEVKQALKTTGVNDIPAAHLLIKLRGLDNDKDMSDKVSNNEPAPGTFVTPDFNFMVADSSELITVMVMKITGKTAPPVITNNQEFIRFNDPGYVKIAINFHFTSLGKNKTLLSTETRNLPTTKKDSFIFGAYWRIIYPGSALIRRVWLDTVARVAEKAS